ncbi:hypothetical protein Tco_0019057 [Tanacetum coccineum]
MMEKSDCATCTGRQTTYAAEQQENTHLSSGSNTGKQRMFILLAIAKGEVILPSSSAGGQALTEEEIAFLQNQDFHDIKPLRQSYTHTSCYQADDLDAYDSDLCELNSAKIAPMANLSRMAQMHH